MRIDLHAHSAISDGTDSPAELVARAVAAGLDVVALTDHDTTAGWAEAAAAAAESDTSITVLPGSEISTVGPTGHTVHLLAYGFDEHDADLAGELEKIRSDRIPRLQRMTERLRAGGSRVTWDGVLAEASAAHALGRPHLADALVHLGEASSRTDAFDRLVGTRCPSYLAKHAPSTAAAIRLVTRAGGVSVIAHPWRRGGRGSLPVETLAGLKEAGLTGIEVDHPDHSPAIRAELRQVAYELDLVPTGSSDYHGTGKVGHALGLCVTTSEAYEALLAARPERSG